MAGVRIRNKDKANCVLTMVDKSRPYQFPQDKCPVCFVEHVFKTYHLQLDDTGSVIVSETVKDRVFSLTGHGFEVVNVVENPPAQTVGVGGGVIVPADRAVVAHDTLKED